MIKNFLKENEVLIYYTTHDRECEITKNYLIKNGIDFFIESTNLDEITRIGITEFPLLVVKNTLQNTYERSWDRKEIFKLVAKEIWGIDI